MFLQPKETKHKNQKLTRDSDKLQKTNRQDNLGSSSPSPERKTRTVTDKEPRFVTSSVRRRESSDKNTVEFRSRKKSDSYSKEKSSRSRSRSPSPKVTSKHRAKQGKRLVL